MSMEPIYSVLVRPGVLDQATTAVISEKDTGQSSQMNLLNALSERYLSQWGSWELMSLDQKYNPLFSRTKKKKQCQYVRKPDHSGALLDNHGSSISFILTTTHSPSSTPCPHRVPCTPTYPAGL